MRVKGVSRGLTNSPLDCWSPGCGRVGLFDSSSLQSKKQPPMAGHAMGGCFLERVKGVEPSSSAWKADVLAVVRHPHGLLFIKPYMVPFVKLRAEKSDFRTRPVSTVSGYRLRC